MKKLQNNVQVLLLLNLRISIYGHIYYKFIDKIYRSKIDLVITCETSSGIHTCLSNHYATFEQSLAEQ